MSWVGIKFTKTQTPTWGTSRTSRWLATQGALSSWWTWVAVRYCPIPFPETHASNVQYIPRNMHTVFALLCFVVVIHLLIFPYPSGLLHWHFGNSASKTTLMNMDKYFMWIHYERLRNHNKAMHNKTVCIFLGIYCMISVQYGRYGRCLAYCYLPKFTIFGKYVRLSVCLSVCLLVCQFCQA